MTGDAGLPHSGSDESGKQIRLDVDLRDAVARVLGVQWKVSYGSFETIVPGVQSGKYQVGQDNFAVTSERLPVVDFATYLKDGQTDLYFGPTLGDKYLVAHQPNLKFLGEVSSTDVGFVTDKGSPLAHALVDAVNELIADGTYWKIFKKWGISGSGITKSQLDPKPAF